MLEGIGVYVIGLIAVAILGFLISLAFEGEFEIGFLTTLVISGLIGVYFIGEKFVTEFNLI